MKFFVNLNWPTRTELGNIDCQDQFGIKSLLYQTILINIEEQVRLSRDTLEFQVLHVPSGLKLFNSQVIYLISFTKRSLVSKTFPFQKSWVLTKLGTQGIVSHRFRETNNEKQFGSKNILDPKKFQTWLDLSQLDLICPDLIWVDPNWLNLS